MEYQEKRNGEQQAENRSANYEDYPAACPILPPAVLPGASLRERLLGKRSRHNRPLPAPEAS